MSGEQAAVTLLHAGMRGSTLVRPAVATATAPAAIHCDFNPGNVLLGPHG
ncbi:hypothetical protein [Nonomuraea terrae]|nr:hypothetical protein [Nonomuraea terrae]